MKALLKQITNLLYFSIFTTFLLLFAVLPFRALYGISSLIALLLQRVFRYRRATTRKNLINAFPWESPEAIKRLERDAYRNLADVSVEALKGFSLSQTQILRRYHIENPEMLDTYFHQGKSVIGVTGHIANWEWGALAAAVQIRHRPIAFYKPLSNPLIDRLLRWSRTNRGTTLVPISQTETTFQSTASHPCIYLLVADQSPLDMSKALWTNFLNQDTPCLHGPEKYGELYDYPVVFLGIKRLKRGFYTVKITEITPSPRSLPRGELTKKYMGMLEAAIRESPADWLWSHRRWKRTRSAPRAEASP